MVSVLYNIKNAWFYIKWIEVNHKKEAHKGHNNISKESLFSVLDESESLDDAKLRKIKEDFNKLRDRFLKPKIKEIRKSLYEIENKSFSESKTKEIEKNVLNEKKSF